MREETQQQQTSELEFDIQAYLRLIAANKWIIISFTIVLGVAVGVWSSLQPKLYEAQSSVLAGRELPRLLSFDDVLPGEQIRDLNYVQTQVAILGSRSFLQKAVKRLIREGFYGKVDEKDVENKSRKLAKMMEPRINVMPAGQSRVLKITVRGGFPDRVARIADAIAEEYVDSNLEKKQQMADQGVTWLESRLAEQKAKLGEAESALQTFKEQENIMASDEEDPFSTLALGRLNEEYLTTRFQRMEREQRIEALKRATKGGSSSSSGAKSATNALDAEVQNAVKEQMKKEYVDGQIQLRELSQRYGPDHPDILSLKLKVDRIGAELKTMDVPDMGTPSADPSLKGASLAELTSDYNILKNKEDALAKTLESHKAAVRNVGRVGVRYGFLKQEVEINRTTYNGLLQRLNETKLSGEIKNPAVLVLDKAEVPTIPVEPNVGRNIMMALVLGPVFSIGFVLLREHLDSRMKGPDDAGRTLGLPVLCVVPELPGGPGEKVNGVMPLLTVNEPRSHVAEMYRNLRTSILFSSGKQNIKTVLVTSAVAGEGKSTTAANLAAVMAQSGRKVLLIDADLRRPALHRYFNREQGRGIVRLLTTDCTLEEAIQTSSVENLDLLLCVGIPPNPSELLGSERARMVMEQLKARYDLIVVDSPVLISVTDSVILAARSDAVLMVHRPGAAERTLVRRARERLDEVQANVIGLVLNKVNLKKQGYRYPEYGYYGYEGYPSQDAAAEKPKGKQKKA
ncbi:MAG TPA: polysaccharide biosynthesis tyrosine autokinase [Candidatus Polarisedimenticolia bacterium]|nr:polysaccharide biosynthesis tyrosine autokinase [Candidatus Polarisedimenticolia bacterium]